MSRVLSTKRGDTFSRVCTWKPGGVAANLTGATVRCVLREPKTKRLVSTLTCTLLNQTTNVGQFTIAKGYTEVDGTHTWPVGALSCDIQFTFADTTRQSTKTFTVFVEEDVS
jgi:hypothetical protein